MATMATTVAKRRRSWLAGRRACAAAVLAVALAAASVGACTTREAEDFLHAAGKIAYDSMKARQQGR